MSRVGTLSPQASSWLRARRDTLTGSAALRASTSVALGLGLSAAAWAVANDGLTNWLVALGMDQERGLLLAACLEVAAGAALAATVTRRTGAVRAGAVLGLLAVQVGPFLLQAAQQGPTPGLAARPDIAGWVLQPFGMVLLGLVAVTVGAALGALLRRDLATLWGWARGHRLAAGPVLVAAAMLTVASAGAATTALQAGPVSALYTYGTHPVAISGPGGAAAGAATLGRGVASVPGPRDPGIIDRFDVAGRHVGVYVPAGYGGAPAQHYAVVYFLHGFPGTFDQWTGTAQLGGVLDQLIVSSQLPPLIAVMPDGNGSVHGDSEWGNTVRGDRVETWLVDQVVPQVDQRYRTLGAPYRGIAGLSAGGFGALNLAARHPTVFHWAASYSGYIHGRASFFGADTAVNSPGLTMPVLPPAQRMAVFIGAGMQDGRYLADATTLASSLRTVGWTQIKVTTVRGGHGWEAWRALAAESLRWLGQLWGPDPGAGPPALAPAPVPDTAAARAAPAPAPAPAATGPPGSMQPVLPAPPDRVGGGPHHG